MLSLTRGFQHRSASLQQRKQSRKRHGDQKRHTDVPVAVDGAWHITRLCQFLVCGWARGTQGRASGWNLFVWLRPAELWCASDRLHLNFLGVRRIDDVAAFVQLRFPCRQIPQWCRKKSVPADKHSLGAILSPLLRRRALRLPATSLRVSASCAWGLCGALCAYPWPLRFEPCVCGASEPPPDGQTRRCAE